MQLWLTPGDGSDGAGNPLSGDNQMCNAAKKFGTLDHVIAVSSGAGDDGVAGKGEICSLDGKLMASSE